MLANLNTLFSVSDNRYYPHIYVCLAYYMSDFTLTNFLPYDHRTSVTIFIKLMPKKILKQFMTPFYQATLFFVELAQKLWKTSNNEYINRKSTTARSRSHGIYTHITSVQLVFMSWAVMDL